MNLELLKKKAENYFLIERHFKENLSYDLDDKVDFKNETHVRVYNEDFKTADEFKELIKHTISEKSVKKFSKYIDKNWQYFGFLISNNKVYLPKDYIKSPSYTMPDFSNMKVLAKKDDVLIVSYNLIINYENKEEVHENFIPFVKEHGDYLIDSLLITNCQVTSEEYSEIVRKHYSIPNDNSRFIALLNDSNSLATFAVYEFKGSDVFMKYACLLNKEKNSVTNLKIFGNRKLPDLYEEDWEVSPLILNYVFDYFNVTNSQVELLTCKVPEDKISLAEKYVDFLEFNFPNTRISNKLLNEAYILIPKYLNKFPSLSHSTGFTAVGGNITFFGVKGDYIANENIEFDEVMNYFLENGDLI